jgi:transcription antitermination protein NusB
MLNRRFLRVKVLQAIYAGIQGEDFDTVVGKKNLDTNIDKIYSLYIELLNILPELRSVALKKIEDDKAKRLPSESDLNPNLKFVDNNLLVMLSQSESLRSVSENKKVNWKGTDKQEFIRNLMASIRKEQYFQDYMNGDLDDDDIQFVRHIFKTFIVNSEAIQDYYEERSIFWLDDLDLAATMGLKSIKNLGETKKDETLILDLFKDQNDEEEFYTELFYKTLEQRDETSKIIDNHADNWEFDRIAVMDILIMQMALTELMEFSSIPKKVTLNEYIDLAKCYSTPKSGPFINGVLDKAIQDLEKQKKINKIGRGLI